MKQAMDLEALLSCFEPKQKEERAFVTERWKHLSRLPDYGRWSPDEAKIWIPYYMDQVEELEGEVRRRELQLIDGFSPSLECRRIDGAWRGPTPRNAQWLSEHPARPDEELICKEATTTPGDDAADDLYGAWIMQAKNAIPEAFEQLVQDGELNKKGETAFRALLNLSQEPAAEVEETLAAVVKSDGKPSLKKLCELINNYVIDNGWSTTKVISDKTLKKWARVIYTMAKRNVTSPREEAMAPEIAEDDRQIPTHQDQETGNVEAY